MIIINLGGTVFGYYYYKYQLRSSPWYLWIFIPDSPNAVLLFAIALALLRMKCKFKLINALAFVDLIKVGIWTLFVFLIYRDYYFSPAGFEFTSILFALHLGMVIEAFVLIKSLEALRARELIFMLFWFLLNDLFDYYLDAHPIIRLAQISLVMSFAFTTSLVICGLA